VAVQHGTDAARANGVTEAMKVLNFEYIGCCGFPCRTGGIQGRFDLSDSEDEEDGSSQPEEKLERIVSTLSGFTSQLPSDRSKNEASAAKSAVRDSALGRGEVDFAPGDREEFQQIVPASYMPVVAHRPLRQNGVTFSTLEAKV